MIKYIKNTYWDNVKPVFTIITPVYNRRQTIARTINSVEKQTYRNIEYIIIDDGSNDSSDDIISNYMSSTDLPVLYIKKNNGGVHTARNIGIQNARGEYIINIDSDDELTKDACETFLNAWEDIPRDCVDDYWQIKGLCIDMQGNAISAEFPENINKIPNNIAYNFFSKAHGEQQPCWKTSVLKKNLFPEPEGVTYVTENVVWVPLEKRYRNWAINKIVRVYHTEGDDHISKTKKKSIQYCKNVYWNEMFYLNNTEIYDVNLLARIKIMSKTAIFYQIIKKYDKQFLKIYKVHGGLNRILFIMLFLPSVVGAQIYIERKM